MAAVFVVLAVVARKILAVVGVMTVVAVVLAVVARKILAVVGVMAVCLGSAN